MTHEFSAAVAALLDYYGLRWEESGEARNFPVRAAEVACRVFGSPRYIEKGIGPTDRLTEDQVRSALIVLENRGALRRTKTGAQLTYQAEKTLQRGGRQLLMEVYGRG